MGYLFHFWSLFVEVKFRKIPFLKLKYDLNTFHGWLWLRNNKQHFLKQTGCEKIDFMVKRNCCCVVLAVFPVSIRSINFVFIFNTLLDSKICTLWTWIRYITYNLATCICEFKIYFIVHTPDFVDLIFQVFHMLLNTWKANKKSPD